jgi:hypothetical protein
VKQVRRILSWESGKAEADPPLKTKRRIGAQLCCFACQRIRRT